MLYLVVPWLLIEKRPPNIVCATPVKKQVFTAVCRFYFFQVSPTSCPNRLRCSPLMLVFRYWTSGRGLRTSDYRAYRTFPKAGINIVPRPFPMPSKRASKWPGCWPAFIDLLVRQPKLGFIGAVVGFECVVSTLLPQYDCASQPVTFAPAARRAERRQCRPLRHNDSTKPRLVAPAFRCAHAPEQKRWLAVAVETVIKRPARRNQGR